MEPIYLDCSATTPIAREVPAVHRLSDEFESPVEGTTWRRVKSLYRQCDRRPYDHPLAP